MATRPIAPMLSHRRDRRRPATPIAGSAGQPQFFHHGFAHQVFLCLSSDGHWKAGNQLDVFGHLEMRQVSTAVLPDGFRRGLCLWFEHNPCADFFAIFGARNAEYLRLRNGGVEIQEFFDFAWIDVLATTKQEVLEGTWKPAKTESNDTGPG